MQRTCYFIMGKGITLEQAQKLFVAFGRLDVHAEVEGTGLGLLSVRHIVDAHGGEVFIEGTVDGLAGSKPFSTAQKVYPSVLPEGFRTAFVVVCPLVAPSASCFLTTMTPAGAYHVQPQRTRMAEGLLA
ncbi:MAG: ATP-binding protein [Sphingobacteriales bacterium]|nr:MAG: ATP-binding protein [Sphingobacteriales bacterium]